MGYSELLIEREEDLTEKEQALEKCLRRLFCLRQLCWPVIALPAAVGWAWGF
jgi:hypothetical protein